MNPVKVMLVDDHTLFRAGMKMLLEMEADFVVVGETGEGRRAVALAGELKPDLVILDISMPDWDGLAVARDLLAMFPGLKILIVSQYENREYIVRATKLGVAGYLLKSAAADELVTALRSIVQGRKYLDAAATAVLMEAWQTGEEHGRDLTEREREILILTAKGKTMKEIGEMLHISPKTVDFHRSRITEKLGVRGRVEMTRYALLHGLIDQ